MTGAMWGCNHTSHGWKGKNCRNSSTNFLFIQCTKKKQESEVSFSPRDKKRKKRPFLNKVVDHRQQAIIYSSRNTCLRLAVLCVEEIVVVTCICGKGGRKISSLHVFLS